MRARNSPAFVPAVVAFALAAGAIATGAGSSKPRLYVSSQAASGAKLYASKCAACHGDRLEGGAGPALTGSRFGTIAKDARLTVGDVFAWVSLQMPLNEPATLKHDQYVDIMAYILRLNGFPAGSTPLRYSEALSAKARMSPALRKP